MKQYIHGGDIYHLDEVTDFSININPLGMPPEAKRAAMQGVEDAGRYPDFRHEALIAEIAAHEDIPENSIIVGNGASELIYVLCRSLMRLRDGKLRASIPPPTFMSYEEAVLSAGGMVMNPKENAHFSPQERILQAKREAAHSDVIFLCHPNNPTGDLYAMEEMRELLRLCEENDTYLCVDESFLPFVKDKKMYEMLPMLAASTKLLVLRSLTKIYGMPGLRLGFLALSDQRLKDEIERSLQPWNLSLPAEYAGISSLKNDEFLAKTQGLVEQEREYLIRSLRPFVRRIWPASADFLFFEAESSFSEKMLERGFLIRKCSNMRGLSDGMFRIAVRTEEENRRLIKALREMTKEAPN